MRLPWRSSRAAADPLVSVVVPAYGVEAYLPECLDSLLAQTWATWEAIVVDDGSPDRSGEIAQAYAARDPRIRVVHVDNGGLGSARNVGVSHARGELLSFLDSDDVLPPSSLEVRVRSLTGSGSDFVTGSIVRWESDGLHEPPWMRRLHAAARGIRISQRPEVLGDVFAWNKVFRRSFWDDADLRWPEGVRYEDQPTTTRAFVRGTFDVVPDIVYHWRIRDDGSSITQQRSSIEDLADRWTTKRMAHAEVRSTGDAAVEDLFVDRVLAGDLWRYFLEIPGASDEWWELLRAGVGELWGDSRSLTCSGLPPVHRLCGWLVEQDRRDDAAALMEWVATLAGPAPQTGGEHRHLDVPKDVLDLSDVDPDATAIRVHERR